MVDFFPESFGVTGGITGQGAKRPLNGATGWSRVAVAAREAVQNMWDARLPGRRPRAVFRINRADLERRRYLRTFLADPLPAALRNTSFGRSIRSSLERPNLHVMLIEDRGTSGLGGPVRPDSIAPPGESTDFVDFFFTVGAPRDRDLGAGTYGYGKAAFFALSRCSLVIVDTLTREGDRRLVGAILGHPSRQEVLRHTGRGWWGRRVDGGIEPLRGKEAEQWADWLGFPKREARDTGTTIMILDPDIAPPQEDRGDDAQWAAAEIRRAIFLTYWPKMATDTNTDDLAMDFEILVEGEACDLPPVEDVSPLNLFSLALQSARVLRDGREPADGLPVHPVTRKGTTLGYLSFIPRGLPSPAHEVIVGDSEEDPFRGPAAWIACMRPAELVAMYRKIELPPGVNQTILGVFLVSREPGVERAFAEAEPPAHDAWESGNTESREHQLMVRHALRMMTRIVRQELPVASVEGAGAVKTARWLGKLMGLGERGSSGGKSSRQRPFEVKVEMEDLRTAPGGREAVLGVTIRWKGWEEERGRSRWELRADPAYVLDGGGLLRAPRPGVVRWELDGNAVPHEEAVTFDFEDESEKKFRLILRVGEMLRFVPGVKVREVRER